VNDIVTLFTGVIFSEISCTRRRLNMLTVAPSVSLYSIMCQSTGWLT